MKFRVGIEHEVAFINAKGQFVDWTNTRFDDLQAIVAELPLYPTDYPQLRVGDAGIKHKRWYVEGFERFDMQGKVIDCPPKGIEIRTSIHDSIEGVVAELSESFETLKKVAATAGFTPVCISFNPNQTRFVPNPPLNPYEQRRRAGSPEVQTADLPMLTQGPDISLSSPGLSAAQIIDAGQKLTYYSPYLVPFSFSSPFYNGGLWEGLSVRTFKRTGLRPAALVFIDDPRRMIASTPSLTQKARLPAEAGRMEFKAFDSCADFQHYARLATLLKGLIQDNTLTGRAVVPDARLHQRSARHGFDDPRIYALAHQILKAALQALSDPAELAHLADLGHMLECRQTPAHAMIKAFQQSDSIEASLLRLNALPKHCVTHYF
ncbi:MAG: glutamate-cysteine ligase family protein [Desulfobacterales bacterium]